ncbi:hypothetical protein GCM10028774_57570 [Spirosoma jeollabukense]
MPYPFLSRTSPLYSTAITPPGVFDELVWANMESVFRSKAVDDKGEKGDWANPIVAVR